jgi:pimeloyl-ACP methyl ester carboxylesterase
VSVFVTSHAKYNLDLSTVQDKVVVGGTNTPEDAMAKRDYARIKRSAMYKWQRELVQAVAEANYCRYWIVETNEGRRGEASRVKRHKVLGRVANTTAVLVMVDYLMDTALQRYEGQLAKLPKISVPTIVLQGDSDPLYPLSATDGQEGFYTLHYQRRPVKGIGHCPPKEAPTETIRGIQDLLRITRV